MKKPERQVEELTPLEKFIGYAVVGTVSVILILVWVWLVVSLANFGRVMLSFLAFVAGPVLVFVGQSLWEHFSELQKQKERRRKKHESV